MRSVLREGIDRAATAREPGVQRDFPSVLMVAAGAGGGLCTPVAFLLRGWPWVGRQRDEVDVRRTAICGTSLFDRMCERSGNALT